MIAPTVLNKPPPPFPAPPRSVDFSALGFILGLVAVITIPALVYAFFFSIKCPPNPFRRRHHRSSTTASGPIRPEPNTLNRNDVISDVKYQKQTHVKEIGTECPVCLSVFADGEEVRQLSVCKHSFHALCINMWLKDHSNCPICRAYIAVDRSSGNNRTASGAARDRDDQQQGLPDASSTTASGPIRPEPNTLNRNDVISDVKYQKQTHVKEIGTECPVCLSVFADGEEVRQLSVCKHSFHALCINMWLKDHNFAPFVELILPSIVVVVTIERRLVQLEIEMISNKVCLMLRLMGFVVMGFLVEDDDDNMWQLGYW
ncbi:RING/U-box superfamily protein, partial [Prunus dulcis]